MQRAHSGDPTAYEVHRSKTRPIQKYSVEAHAMQVRRVAHDGNIAHKLQNKQKYHLMTMVLKDMWNRVAFLKIRGSKKKSGCRLPSDEHHEQVDPKRARYLLRCTAEGRHRGVVLAPLQKPEGVWGEAATGTSDTTEAGEARLSVPMTTESSTPARVAEPASGSCG